MKSWLEDLSFVRKIVYRYRISDIEHFVRYVENLLFSRRPVLDNVDLLVANVLRQSLSGRPVRISSGREVVEALKVLLGDRDGCVDRIVFPSKYFMSTIRNALGRDINDDYPPEILLPFDVRMGFNAKYNPFSHTIESKVLYRELEDIYMNEPDAVFIVSKFINLKGLFRFVKMLKRVSRRGVRLTRTYILTSAPLLEEIREKYNIARIKTRSHAKILMYIQGGVRYCYIGSMNVLAPSKYGDFLLMTKGIEKYCLKYLVEAMLDDENNVS